MESWLEDFRNTIERSAAQLLQISEAESRTSKVDGKWAPKEIIGHLIDSAANNHQRFVRSQFSDDLLFMGYKQDDWVRVQGYIDEPWAQLVELWRHYNLHLLHVMSTAPEETRMKLRRRHNLDQIAWETVGESEPVTLEYFMRDYVGHLQHHLAQVWERRAAS